MTHYRMLDRAPSVLITSNRNELKVYHGTTVYLNNGDNFELRFFNPLPYKIGVEIDFNGMKKGDGYLVLNPGQDLILDRFLDEQRKMIFETYTVDGNNESAIKAIEQNGIINFKFYAENGHYNHKNEIDVKYDFAPKPHRSIKIKNVYNTYNTNWSGSTFTGPSGPFGPSGPVGNIGISGSSGDPNHIYRVNRSSTSKSFSIPLNKDYWMPPTTSSSIPISDYIAENKDDNIYYSDYSYMVLTNTNDMGSVFNCNPIETGRIEKGDVSNQKLKLVNAQFQSSPFHTVTYKILPLSQMNKSIKEVREYCGECGYRLRKSSWKYCPKCGSKLD